MKVELARVPEEGMRRRGEVAALELGIGPEPQMRCEEPLVYDVQVAIAGDQLMVQGELSVRVTFDCARCAGTFSREVQDSGFVHVCTIEDPSAVVDLTAPMRESILLAFPSHPVCRPECKGLCPQCGVNRNLAPCDCHPPEDGRWVGLDGLGDLA